MTERVQRRVCGGGVKKKTGVIGRGRGVCTGRATSIRLPPLLVDQFCFQVGSKILGCEVGMEASFGEKGSNFHRSL